MKISQLGRMLLAFVLTFAFAFDSALAEPRPISARDWGAKSKSDTDRGTSEARMRPATNNFAAPKSKRKQETTKEAFDSPAPQSGNAEKATQEEPTAAPVVEPIVMENATTPAPANPLDSPIAEPAATSKVADPQPVAMPVEDAIDAPSDMERPIAALDAPPAETPHILVPAGRGFAEGEKIELYTQLDTEPIQGGQIRTGDDTIDLNNITIDDLFDRYRDRSAQREELRVSLDDCLQIALLQNLDIQVSEFDPQRNDGELMQARGEFDPTFSINSTYRESTTSPSAQTNAFTGGLGGGSGGGSLLSGLGGGSGSSSGVSSLIRSLGDNDNEFSAISTALSLIVGVTSTAIRIGSQLIPFNQPEPFIIQSEGWQHSASVAGKLHWGTEYELRLNLNVEESTYSGNLPEWDGGVTVRLTQPLLKDRGKKANLARIRKAKNTRLSSEYQLEQTVQQSISEVIKAYWDLVGAHEQMRVAQRSLSNAVQLLSDNQERFRLGAGNQLEVSQAQASVAERKADVITRQNSIIQAENRLKQLLDMRDEFTVSPLRLVPIDPLPKSRVLDIDERVSIQRALENKPDIQSSKLEAENAHIELERANNQLLPELDVEGTYFTGGRGSEKQDVYDGTGRRDDETWTLGFRGSIPITNRQSRGAHTVARISKKQAQTRLSKAQLDAVIGVENAISSVGSNRIAVEARAESRAYQETNVEKQETSLRLGATTSFEVLRTQEDLANAEAQEVQSRIDLEKSLVDLELAEGTILNNHGIEFMPPEEAEAVPFFRSLVPPAPNVD